MEHKVDIEPQLQKNVTFYRYSSTPKSSKEDLADAQCSNTADSQSPLEGVGGIPDFYAQNIKIGNGEIFFDFVTPKQVIKNIQLGVPVEINIDNAVAALAVAWLNGVSEEELRKGMTSFQGAKRRFDFHIKSDEIVLIDDYAHHPEELEASISSERKLYPNRKLTVVFQPHLYSRTHDFYKEFAKSLSLADEVILIPIYPAREEPVPGVSSQMILDLVTAPHKKLVKYDDLVNEITKEGSDVLLMAGAGDIELLVEPVKNKLNG
jgi:UDP-N-acetylmuramate--alanine ligase